MRCGTVQNSFSLTVSEPERRNFDDQPDHRRTERLREGETGGSSVPQQLWRTDRLVDSNAATSVKARERRYIDSIRKLADEIESFKNCMLESAVTRAHYLARAVDNHRKCCKDQSCRLRKTPQDACLIAAALVRMSAADYRLDIKLNDLSKTYLKRVGSEHSMGTVSRTYNVVNDLLNGYNADGNYNCATANVQASAGAPDKSLLKYTQTVLRVCEALELSYPTQLRAEEVVTNWFKAGLGANTPEVIAGMAVWFVVRDEGGQIKAVAEAAGCASDTIKRELAKLI